MTSCLHIDKEIVGVNITDTCFIYHAEQTLELIDVALRIRIGIKTVIINRMIVPVESACERKIAIINRIVERIIYVMWCSNGAVIRVLINVTDAPNWVPK